VYQLFGVPRLLGISEDTVASRQWAACQMPTVGCQCHLAVIMVRRHNDVRRVEILMGSESRERVH
jgi:hypothetical protein